MLHEWRDLPFWAKALLAAGGATTAAGFLWYLLREGDEEELEVSLCYKVTDPMKNFVGIRHEPDTSSGRTGEHLVPGEVFEVSQVLDGPGGQQYLLLKDGRGWAFVLSARDGRRLCEPVSSSDVSEDAKPGSMEDIMQKTSQMLERDPKMAEQFLASMGMVQQMAQESPVVAEALKSRPVVQEALANPGELSGTATDA